MAEEQMDIQTIMSIPAPSQSPPIAIERADDHSCVQLSARDAAQILEDIQNPPAPNEAALRAAKRFQQNYG